MPDNGSAVVIEVNLETSDIDKELAKLKSRFMKLEDDLSLKHVRMDRAVAEVQRLKKELKDIESLTQYDGKTQRWVVDPENVQRMASLKEQIQIAENSQQQLSDSIRDTESALERVRQRYADLTIQSQQMHLEDAANATTDAYARLEQVAAEVSETLSGAPGSVRELRDATEDAGDAAATSGSIAGAMLEMLGQRIKRLASRVFVFSLITMALRAMRNYMAKVIKTNNKAAKAVAQLKGALLTLAQPILDLVIPAFTMLVSILAKVVGFIAAIVSNLFGKSAAESAEAARGINDEAKALDKVGSSAKKAGKSLASFDEINQIGDKSGGGAAGGSSIAPDFSSVIDQQLGLIGALVGGALLAVGAILTFSGVNVPLGLGLMAAGAVTLAATIAENWDAISEKLQGPLGIITTILGGALLVLGAIFAFSGVNIPLGIGMMLAGAATMAATIAANWDVLPELLRGPVGIVLGILTAAAFVIGAIMAFSGANVPLGIGLMMVGAIGLGTAIAVNWNAIVELLQGPIGGVAAILGAAAFVIGSILTFTGANIPLGIGLMLAGAATLGTAVAVNWDSITEFLKGPVGAITALISGALLVLGAVLTFSGGNIFLGIGLMIAGAAGLAASISANWELIQTLLQGPIGTITAVVSAALLVLGAVLVFSGVALPLGFGLLVAGAVGLATSIAANWDIIQETLGGTLGAVAAIASAALLVLGVLLVFTGVGIPLGLGMILAGAAGLATTVAVNWDFVKEKVSAAWDDVKAWWNGNVSKFLTWDYWSDLGKNMLDGLFSGLGKLKQKITDWGSNLVDGVKDFFGIHSPSKTFSELGGYMTAGLMDGMENIDEMDDIFSSLIFNMNEKSKEFTANTLTNTNTVVNAAIKGLQEVEQEADVLGKRFQSMANISNAAIRSIIDNLNAIPRNITTVHTIITQSVSGGSSGGSSSSSNGSKSSTARTASIQRMPSISVNDIPMLAQGAVIPPNKSFLAVLGDQKSGTNIEAPLSAIEAVMRRVLQDYGGSKKVTLECDKRELGSLFVDLFNLESQRIGVSVGRN